MLRCHANMPEQNHHRPACAGRCLQRQRHFNRQVFAALGDRLVSPPRLLRVARRAAAPRCLPLTLVSLLHPPPRLSALRLIPRRLLSRSRLPCPAQRERCRSAARGGDAGSQGKRDQRHVGTLRLAYIGVVLGRRGGGGGGRGRGRGPGTARPPRALASSASMLRALRPRPLARPEPPPPRCASTMPVKAMHRATQRRESKGAAQKHAFAERRHGFSAPLLLVKRDDPSAALKRRAEGAAQKLSVRVKHRKLFC
jgi:hypothetical protein